MATYLADNSTLARAARPSVAARLEPLFLAGEVATCGIVDLELLFSARSAQDYLAILADRASLPAAELGARAVERAIDVQTLLARKGARHRRVTIPELLIAAAAEAAGLRVLHYDADYELIAEVTGQQVEWVVPAGSVP